MRSIKVGPYEYRVREKKIKGVFTGSTDLYQHVIVIAPNQSLDSRRDTYLHETLHAIFSFIHHEQDEDLIHRLSGTLLMVLRDNPELVRELLS